MPVKTCQTGGKPGRKWGDAGFCYVCSERSDGTWNCDEAERKANEQGRAIQARENAKIQRRSDRA